MNWGTAQTAPMILYRVSDDFTAQVRVECDPSLVSNYTGFGFGVRSRSDHATWLQLVRTHALFATRDAGGATSHLNTTPYGSSAVYLKIERSGTSFALGYSENGASWVNLYAGTYANLPPEVDLYLFSFASENPPLSARFSDLRVLK
jgi:regulation of enolase protein 1 (concanavalin A-like superfamily)